MDKISVNPFIYHVPISCFNKYWLFVATLTIFPMRLLIVLNCLFWANLYSAIIIWLLNVFDLHRLKQIEPVRNLINLPCFLLLRITLFTAGIFRLKVNDKSTLISETCLNRKLKQRKSIYLISPHVSFLDLITLILVKRNSTFLNNFNLNKFYFSFLFKNILELLSFKLTKRTSRCDILNGKHSLTIIQTDTLIRIKEALKYNDLIVYPEGITTSGKCLLKFKPDVFFASENVIPVNIIYNNCDLFGNNVNQCDVNTLITTQYTTNYYKMIWLTLCQFGFTVDLNINDIYVPNEEEIQNTELFTENVRALVGRLSGHFLSKYTYDDVRYFKLAKETNTPRSPACIKLLKLCYKVSSYIYASTPPSSPSLTHMNSLSKSLTTIPEQEILEKTTSYQNGLNNNGHLQSNNHLNGGTNGKTHRKLSTVKKPFANQSKNEIFNSQLEYMVIRALKNIEHTYDELNNVNQLMEILDFDNINHSTNHANEFYECLNCTNLSPLRALIITLLLCNTAKKDLYDRLLDCWIILCEDNENKKYITINQFQCLLWFLLGIQSEQITLNEHSFGYEKISFTYLRKYLIDMFRNSVEENAPALLNS